LYGMVVPYGTVLTDCLYTNDECWLLMGPLRYTPSRDTNKPKEVGTSYTYQRYSAQGLSVVPFRRFNDHKRVGWGTTFRQVILGNPGAHEGVQEVRRRSCVQCCSVFGFRHWLRNYWVGNLKNSLFVGRAESNGWVQRRHVNSNSNGYFSCTR
jgi:hypothetical protein